MGEAVIETAPAPAPVLKWPGGKTKLLPELLRRVPTSFGRYHEPFAGGAALFFALTREGRLEHGAVLSDVNPDLVNLYRALSWNVDDTIIELEALARAHRKAPVTTYRRVRRERNRKFSRAPRDPNNTLALVDEGRQWAASMLYLNRTCFNGLWRVNAAGGFNVPLGDYAHKRIDIVRAAALRAAARVLQRAEFHCRDYLQAIAHAQAGDLVFSDPPYVPVSSTASFTGYAAGGFGIVEQRVLASALNALAFRGVHVIASNSDTPLTREIYTYPGLEIESVEVSRAINSRGDRRGKVGEILVTSKHTKAA